MILEIIESDEIPQALGGDAKPFRHRIAELGKARQIGGLAASRQGQIRYGLIGLKYETHSHFLAIGMIQRCASSENVAALSISLYFLGALKSRTRLRTIAAS